MRGAQILVFTVFVAAATARFTVEVMLHSYRNPTHEDCDGGHCEAPVPILFGICDNKFTFCIRRSTASGDSFCVSSTTTRTLQNNDDFTFHPAILATLGIPNPLEFSNLRVTDPVELLITINENDGILEHLIDQIIIPFNSSLRLSSSFSPPFTPTSTCRKARLTISYRIVSDCPTANRYGLTCSKVCEDQMDRYYCNYLGERQCIGKLAPPLCETCLPDYYPPNTCDTFCQPRDDFQGHYTCHPITGEKVCLQGFTNVASCCTDIDDKVPPGSSASKQFNIVVGVGVGLSLLTVIGTY